MIKANAITKDFGPVKVLRGIDFHARAGEVVSIVGASGAGKSTLLQIIGSLSRPDSGKVLINGTDIFALSANDLSDFRNRHIGFVFQFHHLLPEFTAVENIMLPALIAGESRSTSEKKALELLQIMGLEHRSGHKPSELSGGEQQRVAIARAVINRPAVLFADEPSGNLDSTTKKDIHSLFFDLRDKFGQTVVIVTHDRDLAAMSDRMLEMRDGLFI